MDDPNLDYVRWTYEEMSIFCPQLGVNNGYRFRYRDPILFSTLCRNDQFAALCRCANRAPLWIPAGTQVKFEDSTSASAVWMRRSRIWYDTDVNRKNAGAYGFVTVFTGKCSLCNLGYNYYPDFTPFAPRYIELERTPADEIVLCG